MAEGGSSPLQVLLGVGNAEREHRLLQALATHGLQVGGRCLDAGSLVERASRLDVDVALIFSDLHRFSPTALMALRDARLPVVLLAAPQERARYEALAFVLPLTADPEEVVSALRTAVARGASYASKVAEAKGDSNTGEEAALDEAGGGRVTVLVSGKGAPGTTILAIGLAGVLSERGRQVVLVDADLRGGNVGPYLDLDPRRGVAALSVGRNGAELSAWLDDELQEGPGFLVLAGVERAEAAVTLSPGLLPAVVAVLRTRCDEVLIDGGAALAGAGTAGLDQLLRTAQRVFLVARGDLVALWNAAAALRYLRERLGISDERIGVLLNRVEAGRQYGAQEAGEVFGVPVLAEIPEERRAAARAVAEQLPVTAMGGRVAQELRKLATLLAEADGVAESPVASGVRRLAFRLRAAARRP